MRNPFAQLATPLTFSVSKEKWDSPKETREVVKPDGRKANKGASAGVKHENTVNPMVNAHSKILAAIADEWRGIELIARYAGVTKVHVGKVCLHFIEGPNSRVERQELRNPNGGRALVQYRIKKAK